MDNLRNFIGQHRSDFETDALPEGHRERFLRKLGETEPRKAPDARPVFPLRWRIAALSAAAAVLVGIFLMQDRMAPDPVTLEIMAYNRNLDSLTHDIMDICRRTDGDTSQVNEVIRIIGGEAIPLYDQLPEELSDEEKARILRRYFNLKLKAVKQLRAHISEEE